MKRMLLSALFVLATGMLFVGCSDDETTPTAPTGPTSLSSNITGTWSGNLTTTPVLPVIVTVNQAISEAVVAQALTGAASINGGASIPLIGTKEGNVWTLSGSGGGTIVSIHQTLTSATTSTGNFSFESGGVTTSAGLNLSKT